jgi:hypothetical protein
VPGNAPPHTPQKSGQILDTAALKDYIAYTSDILCRLHPPSDTNSRGTPKVTIQ